MKLWVFSGRYAWRLELGQSTDTRAAGSGGEEATGITTSPQRRADWSLSLRSLKCRSWDFSAVQWLRLHASIAGGTGSIPGWATQIPYGAAAQKNKTKQNKTQNPNHLSAPLLSPYLHNFVLLFSSLKCLLVSFALKIQQISSQCQVQVSLLWSLPSQYYCLSSPSIYNWGLTSYYRIVKFLKGKDAEQIFTFRAAK